MGAAVFRDDPAMFKHIHVLHRCRININPQHSHLCCVSCSFSCFQFYCNDCLYDVSVGCDSCIWAFVCV